MAKDTEYENQIRILEEIEGLKKRVQTLETREYITSSLFKYGQSHNLIKNYPSLEEADGAQPEWWDTGNLTLTEEDATGEGLGSPPNERVLKGVTSAANGQIRQTFDPSNEPLLVTSDTVVSFGCWVYVVTAGTLSIRFSDTIDLNIGTSSTTTTGAWVWLEINGVTLGSGILRTIIFHSANNATFYIANPVLNTGYYTIPFSPRPVIYRELDSAITLVSNVDPGGASWTDVDITANSSPLAVMANLGVLYRNPSNVAVVYIRPNGFTKSGNPTEVVRNKSSSSDYYNGFVTTLLDDSQIFEYDTSAGAGDTENLFIFLRGYWRWM